MSYYALFQGWLLLSQPPGCLRVPTTFPTQARLGGLSWRSGLLPSRRRRLAPAASLVRRSAVGIRSLVEFGNRQSAPSPSSALPPTESLGGACFHAPCARLHLHAFRGEPAISGFVWLFTPIHSSSRSFEPLTSSAFQALLGALQPGHG